MNKEVNLFTESQHEKEVDNIKKIVKAHGSALIEAHNNLEHGIKMHRKGGNYTNTPLFKSVEDQKQTNLFVNG